MLDSYTVLQLDWCGGCSGEATECLHQASTWAARPRWIQCFWNTVANICCRQPLTDQYSRRCRLNAMCRLSPCELTQSYYFICILALSAELLNWQYMFI